MMPLYIAKMCITGKGILVDNAITVAINAKPPPYAIGEIEWFSNIFQS